MARATCRHTRSHSTLWPCLPLSPLMAPCLPLASSGSPVRAMQPANLPTRHWLAAKPGPSRCAVSSPSLPSSGHVPATSSPYQYLIEPPTCREKSRTGSVQWLRDRHQPQDFCKFASVLPPESGVTTGKNPRSTTRNDGGRENGADSSPNHARLTPLPAKLSVFADKILKNQKSLI